MTWDYPRSAFRECDRDTIRSRALGLGNDKADLR